MKIPSWILSALTTLLGFAGYGDVATEAEDILTAIGAPTEANLDKAATDLGGLLSTRTKLTTAQVQAIVTVLIGLIAITTGTSSTFVANVENEIAILGQELPIFVPEWKITPEHWAAFVQSVKDCLSDYNIS